METGRRGLQGRLVGEMADAAADHRVGQAGQAEQVDDALRIAPDAADGDGAEAQAPAGGRRREQGDAAVDGAGGEAFQAFMDDLLLAECGDRRVGLGEIHDDDDEDRRLGDPRLAAAEFGEAGAPFGIADDDERNVLGIHRGRRPMRRRDDALEVGIGGLLRRCRRDSCDG